MKPQFMTTFAVPLLNTRTNVTVWYDIKGNDVIIDNAEMTIQQKRGTPKKLDLDQANIDWILKYKAIHLIQEATKQREQHLKHEYEAM